MTIDEMIADLIKREGGYINHPNDKGGPTKYGITIKTLAAWRGHPVTVKDVKNLEKLEAEKIYRSVYYLRPGIYRLIDKKLQVLAFDFAVHSGASKAIKTLQEILNLKMDGIIGPITAKAVNKYLSAPNLHPQKLRQEYLKARHDYLDRMVAADHTQEDFDDGWDNRIKKLEKEYV